MSKYYISTDDELKHYGVKGMKWRHRKNKEGDDEWTGDYGDEEFGKPHGSPLTTSRVTSRRRGKGGTRYTIHYYGLFRKDNDVSFHSRKRHPSKTQSGREKGAHVRKRKKV